MASTESAHDIPEGMRSGQRLPYFFSRYQCFNSAGVEFFAQDVSRVPGLDTQAFGFYPPPVMVEHVVQHLMECHARAVVEAPRFMTILVSICSTRCNEVAGSGASRREGIFFVATPPAKLATVRVPALGYEGMGSRLSG